MLFPPTFLSNYLQIETLSFVVAVSFFLQTLVLLTFLVLANEYEGINLTAWGNVIYGIGFSGTLFQNSVEHARMITFGIFLQISGAFLLHAGLMRFNRSPFHARFYAWFSIIILFFSAHFGLIQDNSNLRMTVFSLGLTGLLGGAGISLLLFPNRDFRMAALLTGAPLLLYALFLASRAIITYFSTTPQSLLDGTWVQILFFLLAFICSTLWSGGLTLMITQRLRHDLHQQARLDVLTQRPNRLFMQEKMVATFHARQPFSVLIIDIDHFKHVNDSYGHAAGDAALRQVAERLSTALRPEDVLGRWGGEEFIVLLPGAAEQHAIQVAERLRLTCAAAPFSLAGHQSHITVSIGIAIATSWPQVLSLETLLSTADKALYTAKENGRNQIQLARR